MMPPTQESTPSQQPKAAGEKMSKSKEPIEARGDVSVGYACTRVGVKRIYTGELLKPWTWLRHESVAIVKIAEVDHIGLFE